jgi:hypothetical protein
LRSRNPTLAMTLRSTSWAVPILVVGLVVWFLPVAAVYTQLGLFLLATRGPASRMAGVVVIAMVPGEIWLGCAESRPCAVSRSSNRGVFEGPHAD